MHRSRFGLLKSAALIDWQFECWLIRPHRTHAVHKMRPIATDAACNVVCVLSVLKRLNRSRCRLGANSRGPNELCIRWGRHPPWEGVILGLSGQLKSIGSLCCSVRSKRDHLILNNGTTRHAMRPFVKTLSPLVEFSADWKFVMLNGWSQLLADMSTILARLLNVYILPSTLSICNHFSWLLPSLCFSFPFLPLFTFGYVLCLLFVLLYVCCGKSDGQNLFVNRPCCHSEHFVSLYYIIMYLLYFAINFVCYFKCCDFEPSGYHANKSESELCRF